MKRYKVEYAQKPTNYNVHRVAIIEAESEEDVRKLWKRAIERTEGIASSEYLILSIQEDEEDESIPGRVVRL